jgi:hypothetical protein
MSMYLLLAAMPSNLHLLTAGGRFIHAIYGHLDQLLPDRVLASAVGRSAGTAARRR